MRPVVGLGPRLDRVLLDRLGGVGHHQREVQLDDVAKPVAGGTGAERAVEREQAWLRRLVDDAAPSAFEPLAEPVRDRSVLPQLDRERRAATFLIAGLDRVGHPAHLVGVHLDPVDHHLQALRLAQRGHRRLVEVVERHGEAVEDEPAEATLAQRPDGRFDRGPLVERFATVLLRGVIRRLVPGRRLLASPSFRGRSLRSHHRKIEPQQQPRPVRQLEQLRGRRLGRFADHLLPALPADRAPDP